MSGVRARAEQVIKNTCKECTSVATGIDVNGVAFNGRNFTKFQSIESRIGLLTMAQTIGEGMVTVLDGVTDGLDWDFYSWVPGVAQSRANGGRSKLDCAFIPQVETIKKKCKKIQTELIHYDAKYCNTSWIGSIFQSGGAYSGLPVFINQNSTLQANRENTDHAIEMLMYQFHTLALAVDGSNIFGDWTGVQQGSLTKDSIVSGGGSSMFPHYDGVIKQALLAGGTSTRAVTQVTLPDLTGDEVYWFKGKNGVYDYASTVEELSEKMNDLCSNLTGDPLYGVNIVDGVATIIAQANGECAYGVGELELFVAEYMEDCIDGLTGTVLQAPTSYDEQPLLFKHSELYDCENAVDYFHDKIKTLMKRCVTLDPRGTFDAGYIAIDPLMLIDFDFAEIQRLCKCTNAPEQTNRMKALMPEFKAVDVMKGTGIWYWSTQANLVYVTNTSASTLPNVKVGVMEPCGTVYTKNEVLGNIIVVDFNKFATNACDSEFHNKLHDTIYQVDNIPNQCVACETDVDLIHACVTIDCDENDPTADAAFTLESSYTVPAGLTATYAWTLGVGNEVVAAGTDATLEGTIPVADLEVTANAILTITLSDGTVETAIIAYNQFVKNCD